MPVSIINRPIGHKLDTPIGCDIFDSSGFAGISIGTHGLSDGDYVFIESNIDSYNGFKIVDVQSPTIFYIKDSIDGDNIVFIQTQDDVTDGCLCYKSLLDHGWQSVHLPIVYELFSDIFPTNYIEEGYVNVIVDAANNVNGYTDLTVSADIPNINILDYIELIGNGPLAGKYQIIDILDPNFDFVINLVYNATNDFTPYEVRGYYNNYFITVNVWGGLESGHRWVSTNPFGLLASLKLIPDSENKVKFSISEILKGQITTRNNLTLDTLPNNLDFLTEFYITYSESYDSSDGTQITTFTDDIIDDSDNFIGQAVNSMMPFKSLNMGHMSEYLNSKWLTIQDVPVAFVDYFYDISFINIFSGVDIQIEIFKSFNGVVTDTEYINIDNPGLGIIRVPFMPQSGFDQYCIRAKSGDEMLITSYGAQFPSGDTWTIGANITVTVNTQTKKLATHTFIPQSGLSYQIIVNYTILSGFMTGTIKLGFMDIFPTDLYTDIKSGTFSGSGSETFTMIGKPNTYWLYIQLTSVTSEVFKLDSITVLNADVTEQICINIVDACDTFTNDHLRLLEGGEFRELE